MGPSFKSVVGSLYSELGETYNYMTDGEFSNDTRYTYRVLRHSRPFVVYQGVKTNVAISVFGDEALSQKREVWLQMRGWRTGLFGWTLGSMLGGAHLPGIEVTPITRNSSSFAGIDSSNGQDSNSISPSTLSQLKNDITRLVPPHFQPKHQQTLVVHIPVMSGDGYFRLLITSPHSSSRSRPKILGASPSFRLGSLTLASAHPRGASLLTLPIELFLRTLLLLARTAAVSTFIAMFPFVKVASLMPGPWKKWAARRVYQFGGGEERFGLKAKVEGVGEKFRRANEKMAESIPLGTVGIRTASDLLKDKEMGRRGVWIGSDVMEFER